MLLAETSWIEGLAGFPTDIQIQSMLLRCLDFQIRLEGLAWQAWLQYSAAGRAMN